MDYVDTCLFCRRPHDSRKESILAHFVHCYVMKDEFPVTPGHILIIPYQHTENWFTASEEVRIDMMHALDSMKNLLNNMYSPDGYNIGMNCGTAAGQTIMHLHLHLIPRYTGDMEDPRGGIRGVIPGKQKY